MYGMPNHCYLGITLLSRNNLIHIGFQGDNDGISLNYKGVL